MEKKLIPVKRICEVFFSLLRKYNRTTRLNDEQARWQCTLASLLSGTKHLDSNKLQRAISNFVLSEL